MKCVICGKYTRRAKMCNECKWKNWNKSMREFKRMKKYEDEGELIKWI